MCEHLDSAEDSGRPVDSGEPYPPGFIRLDTIFDRERALSTNNEYLPAINSRGLVHEDLENAVVELMLVAGITRSEAACHIMLVGLEVNTRLMQCIKVGFPPAGPKGDCT